MPGSVLSFVNNLFFTFYKKFLKKIFLALLNVFVCWVLHFVSNLPELAVLAVVLIRTSLQLSEGYLLNTFPPPFGHTLSF